MTVLHTQAITNILAQVEELTEKPVILHQDDTLTLPARVKMARHNMDAHYLYYKNTSADILNHLIAHECGHIIRTFSLPPAKRKTPIASAIHREAARKHIERELRNSPVLPVFTSNSQLLTRWHDGMVLQLTNVKPDIEIEKWIYTNHPELRLAQQKSVARLWHEALQVLSDRIKKTAPKSMYIASNALNYVQYRAFSELTGNPDYVNPYIGRKDIRIADQLYQHLAGLALDDYESDIFVTNQWAELLGLSDWFIWTDFEDVSPDYMEYT